MRGHYLNIEIGSVVTTSEHPYNTKISCVVDRIYRRGNADTNPNFCRLVYWWNGKYRRYNALLSSCELDISEKRSIKLNNLLKDNNSIDED